MQFITIIAAIFATSALAAPFDDNNWNGVGRNDWNRDNNDWNRNNNNGGWGSGNGGNEEGPYQRTCTCVSNGRNDQWLGQSACQNLGDQFPNLYWDGNGCVDAANQGVEYNGFRRACQDARGWNGNVDAQCN